MRQDVAADVAVIGAGPTGSAAAWRLASAGLQVVCIERGGWFDYARVPADEAGFARLAAGALNPNPNVRRAAADYPIEDDASPIEPMLGNGVGGGSIYWAAHAPRFRPEDFRVFSEDGVADDWPITYDELAPWYALNERRIGLAWRAGDPCGPRRGGAPLPLPPIGAAGERIGRAFERLGWHCWPVDLVVGREAASPGAPPCRHRGPCRIGCPARVRAGADRAYVRPALAAGGRLLTHTRVLRLEHDGFARVTAAVCAGPSGRFRVTAARFVLAANGIGTPRLLLASASGAFPNGLANGSGLVGRRLMLHPYAWADGWFPEPLEMPAGQTAGLVSLEFGSTRAERGFVRGCKLQLSVGAPAPGVRFDGCEPPGADPRAHVAGLSVCAEDLPDPENRVEPSPDRIDEDGVAAPRMVYRVSSNTRAILDFGLERAAEALREAGAAAVERVPLKAQAGFHLMGTARMGNDPASSVTDRFGRCHQTPNLFIADASTFVTASALNPTATAQALALRTADHIAASARD